jgi:hypothetical protein
VTRALVVFESMYGDNQQVAHAIAEGLQTVKTEVEVVSVNDAPTTVRSEVGLLVVGGPNHAAGMTRRSSRDSAKQRNPDLFIGDGIGLREWFEALERSDSRMSAVAYDTRLAKPRFMRWFDRASRGIEKRLKQQGFHLVEPAEHFYVMSEKGPLADGELERAKAWGVELARFAVPEPATP